MGYREYFCIVNKTLVDELRQCKTKKDVYEVFIKYGFEADCIKTTDYNYNCPIYNIKGRMFEFGKGYENSIEIKKMGTLLFTSEELQKEYDSYNVYFGGVDFLECAIKWQENYLINYYENLVNNTYSSKIEELIYKQYDEKEAHYQRLLSHCEDYISYWKPVFGDARVVNMNKSEDKLTDSYLYEHSIFDLIRLYKDFDEETQYVLFFGW